VPVLFGAEFADGVPLARLLCVRFCLALLTWPIGAVGYSLGLAGTYLWINVTQVLVAVALNLVLLPRIGAMGAALAMTTCDAVGAIWICWSVLIRSRRTMKEAPAGP